MNQPQDEFARLKSDLVWAVTSPSLVRSGSIGSAPLDFDRNRQIDPVELAAYVAKRKSHRVGHYFETLISFWLEKICQVDLVVSGFQIKQGSRTVGELDFVFRDEQDRLNHWETAVKFYLHYPHDNSDSVSHFIGPNAADNFEKKIARMLSHQLPLSRQVFPDVEIRHAFVKGIIFFHPQIELPRQIPEHLAIGHLRGKWIRQSELDLAGFEGQPGDSNPPQMFRIMQKPFWLSSKVVSNDQLFNFDQLQQKLKTHFAGRAHPLMVSSLTKVSESHRETERLLIVSDSWPQRDTKPSNS